MIYAYDQWAQMPTKDIYDTQMMAMAINAAKDMYNRGEQEIKDFRKEYGDFYSPIQKDMDWYSKNVTNKIQNTIDGLYSAGIDPIRSAEGRAAVRKAINSIDTGTISKLKESAINASAFNKAKLELQSKGLFNPLLEKYDGPQLSDYSTVDSGVWNRMSPTPYQNMAAFSKDYFDNIKPISRSMSKNGVNYTKREITEQDLHNIANSHFNDLVTTPQGQLMYKMYLDVFGGDSKAAKKAFNDSVVSGNMDRLYYEDDYNDNWYKNQNLQIGRMRLNIARQNAIARQNGAGRGTSKNGTKSTGNTTEKGQFDYQDFLTGTTAANILAKTSYGPKIGVGGVSDYTPEKVSGFMGAAQKELAEKTYSYNTQSSKRHPLTNPAGNMFDIKDHLWNSARNNILSSSGGLLDIGSRYDRTFNVGAKDMSASDLDAANKKFLSQMSVPASTEHFAKWTQRKKDNDNPDYVLMNLGADKGRIYSADEVALTSAGVDRPKDVPAAVAKTKELRKNLESRYIDGKTMMKSEGFVVGRVGNDGANHIFQKIRVSNKQQFKDAEGNLKSFNFKNLYNDGDVIYYDMGADTQGNPNYKYDFMENMTPVITDQSLGSDRNVLESLGLSSTNVKSDNSVPYLDYSSNEYDDYDDDLLDLMGY